VRFLRHNIRDDFDDLTDVARLYRVRAVPCFVFFVGGAQASTRHAPRLHASSCRMTTLKHCMHGLHAWRDRPLGALLCSGAPRS
jgi:hypothetical protein